MIMHSRHSKQQQYSTPGIGQPVECTRNIGVIFDRCPDRQIEVIRRASFFHPGNIVRIKNHHTKESVKSIIHKFVPSWIIMCYIVASLRGTRGAVV